tara:strand:- start:1652 stop:1876 length:225 start_codon:yes stop_codon:yes gene_type:complete
MAKRGRPAGSTSFVNVDMRTLNNLFNENVSIQVSRIWLKNLGIEVAESKSTQIKTQSSLDTLNTEPKIEMNLQP